MNNKIRKIKTSDSPSPARAIGGPMTAGIEYNDIAGATGGFVVAVDDATPVTRRYLVERDRAETLTNKTLTAPVINGATGTQAAEVVAATNVIEATENGKTFYLSHATEFVSTLPAPFLGGFFRFIVAAAPSGASYTVVTNAAAEVMVGGAFISADGVGDVDQAGTTLTFVDGQAVAGDSADFFSDGNKWFVRAFAAVAAGVTITG